MRFKAKRRSAANLSCHGSILGRFISVGRLAHGDGNPFRSGSRWILNRSSPNRAGPRGTVIRSGPNRAGPDGAPIRSGPKRAGPKKRGKSVAGRSLNIPGN